MTTHTSTTKYIPRCIEQCDMINMREQTRILNEWDWNRTSEMLTSFMESQPNGPFLLYTGTRAQRQAIHQRLGDDFYHESFPLDFKLEELAPEAMILNATDINNHLEENRILIIAHKDSFVHTCLSPMTENIVKQVQEKQLRHNTLTSKINFNEHNHKTNKTRLWTADVFVIFFGQNVTEDKTQWHIRTNGKARLERVYESQDIYDSLKTRKHKANYDNHETDISIFEKTVHSGTALTPQQRCDGTSLPNFWHPHFSTVVEKQKSNMENSRNNFRSYMNIKIKLQFRQQSMPSEPLIRSRMFCEDGTIQELVGTEAQRLEADRTGDYGPLIVPRSNESKRKRDSDVDLDQEDDDASGYLRSSVVALEQAADKLLAKMRKKTPQKTRNVSPYVLFCNYIRKLTQSLYPKSKILTISQLAKVWNASFLMFPEGGGSSSEDEFALSISDIW